jgi:hypothetical protein
MLKPLGEQEGSGAQAVSRRSRHAQLRSSRVWPGTVSRQEHTSGEAAGGGGGTDEGGPLRSLENAAPAEVTKREERREGTPFVWIPPDQEGGDCCGGRDW